MNAGLGSFDSSEVKLFPPKQLLTFLRYHAREPHPLLLKRSPLSVKNGATELLQAV